MNITKTLLPGVLVIEPDVFRDERGFFFESYQQKRYAAAGLPDNFVQDNHSRSQKGTLRGLHTQVKRPQGKLVRIITGEVFDVVVDVRPGSPTFKKWYGVTLSASNFKQCWIPPGYAHGFCTLSDYAEMEYKVTDFYDPTDEITVAWDDPELAIDWPIKTPLVSPKDRAGLRVEEAVARLPAYAGK